MTVSVGNAGNVTAAGRTTVKVYASTDEILDAATDRLVATVPVTLKLKAGTAKSVKAKFVLPADLAAGSDVTLIAAVDADGAVAERNEADNTAAVGPFTVG